MVQRPARGARERRPGAALAAAAAVLATVPAVLLAGPGRPAAATDLAGAVLSSLTLEQQVGEVFMVGGPATGVGAATVAAVRDRHVGGVILTGRSTLGVAQTATITAGLQAQATAAATGGVGLLVAADQEGGQVQVLQGTGFSAIPSALVQGSWSPATLRTSAAGWGRQLLAAGVQVDLAPVLDTVPAPATNPPIGVYDREYGSTPDVVAAHGTAFALGMADAGVAATGKHFPGLGRVTANTDTTAGVTDTVTTRTDPYLQPFATAAGAGLPLLMMSTAYYSRIDAAHPAAFSPVVVDGMVRGDLGFGGVVVSDDLGSAAQVEAWAPGDRALQFLAAGGDLVLTVDPAQLPAMYDAVLARARASDGFRARVQQAALRVLELKAAHGLLPARAPTGDAHSLVPGQILSGGQWVLSPDGHHGLTMQTDGNLVAYGPGDRPLWSSATYGHPGALLVLQTDGNAVVYAGDGSVLWDAGTWAHPGDVLRAQDDGNVVVYAADGTALWYSGWDRAGLLPGQFLLSGQQVTSPSGRYWLVLQRDGNVVVYCRDGRPLFYTGSWGAALLTLRPDGDLVATDPGGTTLWDSGTGGQGPLRLAMQDDGNAVLYRGDGSPAWYSGWDTGGVATAPGPGTRTGPV